MSEAAGCIDLHTHSTVSDGMLSPQALVRRAATRGVRLLALTDHDTTAGVGAARREAESAGIAVVAGVELSLSWSQGWLHVLGLEIDPAAGTVRAAEGRLACLREERAVRIAGKLAKAGIEGTLEGARQLAGGGQITRTHFARLLCERGVSASQGEAFKRYLGRRGKAHVTTPWPAMEEGIAWIRAAGGLAVLAHPLAYRLTASRMRRLLTEFAAAGGEGIEVACGGYSRPMQQTCAGWALRHGLCGSVGSDFHSPDTPWNELGPRAVLPPSVEPVWARMAARPA